MCFNPNQRRGAQSARRRFIVCDQEDCASKKRTLIRARREAAVRGARVFILLAIKGAFQTASVRRVLTTDSILF